MNPHSLELLMAAHPWGTLLVGMGLTLVPSCVVALSLFRREAQRHVAPSIWTRVLERIIAPQSDPLRQFQFPEFQLTTFIRDEANILGVSVPSREVAQSLAERYGAALREALAAEGRGSATVLFLAPGDFLLLPPSEPVPAPSLGPLHSRSLFE